MDLQRLALKIAEKLREAATRQGTVPFDKGDLRKAHVVEPLGVDGAQVSVNTPYARAVHDGRPALIIRPKRKKALVWNGGASAAKSVAQPKREGQPWLRDAIRTLENEGLSFLAPDIGEEAADALAEALRAEGASLRKL